MAKAKPAKQSPKPDKPAGPDPEVVKQIVAGVEAQLQAQRTADTVVPEGAQAGLFDGGGKGLSKLVSDLAGPMLKFVTAGADGRIDAAEVADLTTDLFELVSKAIARRREAKNTPAAE